MIFPLVNQQISTRVTAEELAFLNELIGNIMPDQDWNEPTLTLRTVFMKIAETADLKLHKQGQSKPEDLKTIEDLRKQLIQADEDLVSAENKLKELFNKQLQEKDKEIADLIEASTKLAEQLGEATIEHSKVSEKALKLEKYAPVLNERRIIVEPLTGRLLDLYAEKIRLRTKVDVSPGEILTTLFNRYVTKRETELPGFPFLVSKQEIIELAKELENE